MSRFVIGLICLIGFVGCQPPASYTPKSNSGISQAKVDIEVNENGHSLEQENVIKRYKLDNAVGSIKHLYVISPISGQVLIYSTVDGKVTSSGKRLTPKTVSPQSAGDALDYMGMPVTIDNWQHYTSEVIQDDGTYGDSIEYLYWFDSKGNYHQQYVGDCIVHISDQPLPIKNIVLNLEVASQQE